MAEEDLTVEPEGAEEERHALTAEELARREAALDQITQLGDPVLRTSTVEITGFTADLTSLAAHMVSLMDDAHGAGLAAPQVGRPLRMFVYRVDGSGEARAIVNPRLEPTTEETEVMEEGCLSIGRAGVHVPVERPIAVRMRAQLLDGTQIDEQLDGYSARIVQHETDHLDGVLMLERTTPEARRAALRALHGRPAADPA